MPRLGKRRFADRRRSIETLRRRDSRAPSLEREATHESAEETKARLDWRELAMGALLERLDRHFRGP